MDKYRGSDKGVIVQCERGYVLVPSYIEAIAFDRDGQVVKQWEGGGKHHENWLSAIHAGDCCKLNADILEGHLSSALCHLANISYRLGNEVPFRPRTEALGDNADAYEALERMEEHLSGQGLKLEEMPRRVGRKLSLDVETESLVDDSQADAMLTREYRKPFTMPEAV